MNNNQPKTTPPPRVTPPNKPIPGETTHGMPQFTPPPTPPPIEKK